MPDKDGDDEKKSTKSVVTKKQKQLMNTEEFSDKQRSDMRDILNKNFGSEDKSKETAGKLIKDKAKKDVERVQGGKQPNKSTPSTKLGRSKVDLNKYFGEEGYDIARDMGRVRPSKDKKDATTMPPSKEMEKTRKVYKGPSALELIKKKYKGQIMDLKKEELDLTQVAEVFGGYIVEQTTDDEKKTKQEKSLRDRVNKGTGTRTIGPKPKSFNDPEADKQREDAENDPALEKIGQQETGKKRPPRKGVDYFFDAEKAKADRDAFQQGRKAYTDSKSGIKAGKVTDKGIVDYITKARDMKQGTNANTKANREAAKVIAKSAGKEYEEKIRKKYETDKDLPRRRGKNQPSYADVKADIDAKNPTYLSPIKTMGKDGEMKNRPLPFPTRKTTVKGGKDLMKNFLKKEKDKGKNIKDIEDDPRLKDIESDPQGQEIRGKIERETGTRTRPFTRIGKTSGDIIKTDPKTGKETEVTPSGRVKPIGTLGRRAEKAQQSTLGALGGFLAKSAVPATAGLEAAERLRKGEKGVALSAIQAMDIPVLSKAAGIMNAIQTVRRGQQAAADQQAMVDAATGGGGGGRKGPRITSSGGEFDREGPKPTKGGEGLAAVGDGAETDTVTSRILATQLPNIGKRLRQGARGIPRGVVGGTVGRRSARGGGGL